MPRPYASGVVPASSAEVWEKVRPFNGLPAWHPAIETSTRQADLSAQQDILANHAGMSDLDEEPSAPVDGDAADPRPAAVPRRRPPPAPTHRPAGAELSGHATRRHIMLCC